jgi:hypothetical protein
MTVEPDPTAIFKIGKFGLFPLSGESIYIKNLASEEGMEVKIELLEEAIEIFWDKEF